MDPSISPLFSAEEIIGRLVQRKMTGCFKAFTSFESANIFLKKGMIVAADKGDAQGEPALRAILDWEDAQFIWQPNIAAPIPPLKPVLINFEAFLRKQDVQAKISNTGIMPAKNKPNDSSSITKSITTTGEIRVAHESDLAERYKLTLASLANTNHKFKLTKATSVIGRNPSCDISIPDTSISRQHCILQLTERGLDVKDLNTVNGTKINDIPMKEGYINIGDKLTVGKISFLVEKTAE